MYRAAIADNEVLPMAGLTFPATSTMNVRLSAAKTVGRPEFREIAPFQFTDFVGGASLVGNTSLQSFHIWNADARWEWFPSASEVVAVSVFYKYFDDPIERVAFQTSSSQAYTFRNADHAHNLGVELELRKNLEFIAKRLRAFSLGFNAAYVHSQVRLPARCRVEDPSCDVDVAETSTSRVRALQGQSPFVANAYLDYDNEDTGTGVRLLYNTVLRNIAYVGRQSLPDIYEEARHQVDFVFSQHLGAGISMGIDIENILAWPVRYTQGKGKGNPETGPYPGTTGPGEALYLRYDYGTTFMLGLRYDLGRGGSGRH